MVMMLRSLHVAAQWSCYFWWSYFSIWPRNEPVDAVFGHTESVLACDMESEMIVLVMQLDGDILEE